MRFGRRGVIDLSGKQRTSFRVPIRDTKTLFGKPRSQKGKSHSVPESQPLPPPLTMPAASEQAGTQVVRQRGRAAGYLIDLLPALLAGLFGLIPIVGAVLVGLSYGLLAAARYYWSEPRQALSGSRCSASGSQQARVRSCCETCIAIGPALNDHPLLGYVLAPIVSMIIMLVEVIFLLTQGSESVTASKDGRGHEIVPLVLPHYKNARLSPGPGFGQD